MLTELVYMFRLTSMKLGLGLLSLN